MKILKEDLIKLYYEDDLSLKEIGSLYNVTHIAVLKWFKKYNIPRRTVKDSVSGKYNKHINNQHGRKYTINSNFFKKWNSDMAWVLGFICADGCIETSNTLSVCQKDKEPLEYILKLLGSNASVEHRKQVSYARNNIYRIRIRCKKIVDDLINIGISKKKSLTLKFPDIPDEYFWDFIRGYFDGDGSIYFISSQPKNPKISFVGSVDFIETLNILVCNKLKCPHAKIDYYRKQTPKIVYRKKELIKKIGMNMYKNPECIKLIRKYNIFKEWCEKQ